MSYIGENYLGIPVGDLVTTTSALGEGEAAPPSAAPGGFPWLLVLGGVGIAGLGYYLLFGGRPRATNPSKRRKGKGRPRATNPTKKGKGKKKYSRKGGSCRGCPQRGIGAAIAKVAKSHPGLSKTQRMKKAWALVKAGHCG